MANINDKLIQLAEAKSGIKDAIIAKGVEVDASLPFLQYADKIREISGGSSVKKPNVILNSENLVVTDDNIVSGFTNGAFPRFGVINLGNGSWKFHTKIKTPAQFNYTGTSVTNTAHILSCRRGGSDYGSNDRYGVHIYIQQNPAVNQTVTLGADIGNTTGTDWLYTAGSGFKGGLLVRDTIYYIILSFDGVDTYKLEYSTDKENYTTAVTKTSTTKTYPILRGNKFGVYGGASLENAFQGLKVYLEDTYIKAGNDIVWKGVTNS